MYESNWINCGIYSDCKEQNEASKNVASHRVDDDAVIAFVIVKFGMALQIVCSSLPGLL